VGRRQLLLGRSLQEPLVSYSPEYFLPAYNPSRPNRCCDSSPPLGKHFTVRCDACGKRYTYKPKDVRRLELELPESFKPYPLFREDAEDEALVSNRVTSQEVRQEDRPKEEAPQKEHSKGNRDNRNRPKSNHLKTNRPKANRRKREKSELKAHDSLRTRRASFSALTCDLLYAVLCH
jgi:hypothetical protein